MCFYTAQRERRAVRAIFAAAAGASAPLPLLNAKSGKAQQEELRSLSRRLHKTVLVASRFGLLSVLDRKVYFIYNKPVWRKHNPVNHFRLLEEFCNS